MVKTDHTYQMFLFTGIFNIGMLVVFSLFPIPAELQHLFMFVYLLAALVYLMQAWRLKPLQLRRQMAATGAIGMLLPLAARQPTPNQAALALPFTIRLRPNWTVICIASLVIWLLLPLGCFFLFWPHIFSDVVYFTVANTNTTSVYPLILLPGGFFAAIAALMGGIFLWQGYARIEVYDSGLRVVQGGHDTFIRWNEARLFAIFPLNLLSRRSSLPTCYEVSSRYSTLHLPRVYRKMTFSQFSLPAMSPRVPFDEYDRQMDALLSLIAAKTRLPLYDLR